ncbi:translation initiation factor IF-6 [Methanocaldococcus infernus]|uniref:Translation initiation factor 6 n=1 Tax=Methanocaldococcus infernus (strain DSM 11812 / JCM 15783 / ME) TaxID=573063 RepID=D5VR77_METIM|nr:translation initiation factor IF-6 [Methanocaldococcus infernus]ADG13080.1 translation initiation factor eIF-6 [Methanocaldococcus infernus ME]
MIIRKYFSGIPNIGVLALTTEELTLLPLFLSEKDVSEVKEALKTEVFKTNIANSSLIGSLAAANSRVILLPGIVEDEEVEGIKNFIRELGLDVSVEIINVKNTALGNLILVNDYGCLISKELEDFKKEIEDIFNLPTEVGTIADLPTVGSNAVVTNKGLFTHPLVEEDELKALKELFKVEYCGKGTVNKGSTSVGSGIIANTKGIIVGGDTTGPEILQIEDALGLI